MSYVPQQGSVAWKVIEFLTTNPEEELSRDDISAKFDADSRSVHNLLRMSVESGLLKRIEGDDELVYRLDNGTPLIKANRAGNPTLGKLGAVSFPSVSPIKRRVVKSMPDLDGLVIEDGIEKPTRQLKNEQWFELFNRMKPGQSFCLAVEHKYAVGKAASNFKRDGYGELSIKQINDTEVRVWRDK